MAGCRRAAKSPAGWLNNSGLRSLHRNAAGRPCGRSTGRSRGRAQRTRSRQRRRRKRRSKKTRRHGGRRSREASGQASRGLGYGRASARPKADPAPGLGADRRAADRARSSPLRMALRHRLRCTGARRDRLVSVERHRTNPSSQSCSKLLHGRPAPGATASSCFNSTMPAGTVRKTSPFPTASGSFYQPPYSPQLQPAEHLWPLVDEPLANTHFDTIDNLDAVVAKRCCHLHQDQQTIASHTNFHWWPKSINPN